MTDGIVISVDHAIGKSETVLACSKIDSGSRILTLTHMVEVRSTTEAEGWVELLSVGIDKNRILFAK